MSSCRIPSPIEVSANNVGITERALIFEAYKANNEKAFTDAPIYTRLTEEINQELTGSTFNEALLLTIYSLTNRFKVIYKDSTLENLRRYRERIERENEEKKKQLEQRVNVRPVYKTEFGEGENKLILNDAQGQELYKVLLALEGTNKQEHFQKLAVELDPLQKIEELQLEEDKTVYQFTKGVYVNFAAVEKWYNDLRGTKSELEEGKQEANTNEESDLDSTDSQDIAVNEETAKVVFERAISHISELAGQDLSRILDSIPVVESVWTKTLDGVTKQVHQIKMSKLFRAPMAREKNKQVYNLILTIVSGSESYTEAITRLERELDSYPQLEKLLQALPPKNYEKGENMFDREKHVRIVGDFMNTFALVEVTPYVAYMSRLKGNSNLVTSRVYSLMSGSEIFGIEKFDRDLTKDSRRQQVLTNGKLDLKKLFFEGTDVPRINGRTQTFSSLSKLLPYNKNISFEEYYEQDENGKYRIKSSQWTLQSSLDFLSELLFYAGIDTALEFKSDGRFHSDFVKFLFVDSQKTSKGGSANLFNVLTPIVQKLESKYLLEARKGDAGNFLLDKPLNYLYDTAEKEEALDKYGLPSNKANFLDIKKTEFKKLFILINKVKTFEYSPSYFNAEGKLKYAVGQKNHLIQVTGLINSSSSVGDLVTRSSAQGINKSAFDVFDNPDILGSIWISKFFSNGARNFPTTKPEIIEGMTALGLDFQKREDRLAYYATFKKVSGAKISIGDYNGTQTNVVDDANATTSNLDISEKIEQDFIGFFDKNIVENIRFGEKTSSYFTNLTYPGREANPYYIQYTKGELVQNNLEFISTFQRYSASDLERIFKNIANPDDSFDANDYRLFYGDLNRDEESQNKLKELQEAVNAAKGEYENTGNLENLSKEKNRILSLYQAHVLSEFPKYLATKRNELKNNYLLGFQDRFNPNFQIAQRLYNNILNVKKKGTFAFENIADLEKNLNSVLDNFIVNVMINNIEFMKVFHGSLSNFSPGKTKDGFREVYKRVVNMSSPGKIPQVDSQISQVFSESLEANKFSALYGKRGMSSAQNWGIARTLVFTDVDTFFGTPETIDEIWETYRKEYSLPDTDVYKAYVKGPKEADAQAVASLEFYRNYLTSTGTWTAEQSVTYELEFKIAERLKEFFSTNDSETKNRLGREIASLKEEIANKIKKKEAAPLPPLKLGHYGRSALDPSQTIYHKMSVLPLLPSSISSGTMYPMIEAMYQNGIDYYVFASGSKEKNSKKPIPFYDDNGKVNTDFTPENASPIFVANLRELQYQEPKFKERAVLTTQGVKLLFKDFYEDGKFKPYYEDARDKQFEQTLEEQKKKLAKATEGLEEIKKAELEEKLGIKRDNENNFVSFDEVKLAAFIAEKFDEESDLRQYLRAENGKLIYNLEAYPNKARVYQAVLNAVTKNIISLSIRGDSLIQAANTPYLGKRNVKEFTKEGKGIKYDPTLQFYKLVNGKVQKMEIMVAWDPKKHGPLLNLKYGEKKLGDYENPITLLNRILSSKNPQDIEWVEEHDAQLSYTGVRIPVQGAPSMESMRVKKFLPSSAGNLIVLPPQIVTKSGGDYDIDKLTVYYPNLDKNGKVIKSTATTKDYLSLLKKEGEVKKNTLLADREKLKKILVILPESYPEEKKKKLQDLYESLSLINGTLANPKLGELPKKSASGKDIISETADQILSLTPRALDSYIANNNLPLHYENQIMEVMHTMLSLQENYLNLVKPNDSPNLKDLAKETKSAPISAMDVFSPTTSYRIFSENILARSALGIDAKMNTMHKMFQQAGIEIRGYIGDEQIVLGDAYLFPSNKKENGNIPIGMIHFKDGKEVTISEILNQFINGHVDAGNEDYLLRLGMSDLLTPTAHAMLLMGTNHEIVFKFLNNPLVVSMITRTTEGRLFGRDRVKIINQVSDFISTIKGAITAGEIKDAETIEFFSKIRPVRTLNELNAIVRNALNNSPNLNTEEVFSDLNNLFNENQQFINPVKQLLAMHQLAVVLDFQDSIRKLTSRTDFNTARYPDPIEVISIQEELQELSQAFTNVNKLINPREDNVLNKFNQVEYINSLFRFMFPITFSPEFAKTVYQRRAIPDISTKRKNYLNKKNQEIMISYAQLLNEDSFRGNHQRYFFSTNLNKVGTFFEVNGQSQIVKDLEELKDEFSDLLRNNLFISMIKPTSVELSDPLDPFNPDKKSRFTEFRLTDKVEDETKSAIKIAIEELRNSGDSRIKGVVEDILLASHYFNLGAPFSPFSLKGADLVPVDLWAENSQLAYERVKTTFERKPTPGKYTGESYLTAIGNQLYVTTDADKRLFVHGYIEKGSSQRTQSAPPAQPTPQQPPQAPSSPVNNINVPKGEKVQEGIYVNQGALTKEEQLELFNYLKPYLEEQAAKTLKAASASKMIGLGLRWDYKSNNPNLSPIDIKDIIGGIGQKNKYGYYTKSINGLPLAQIPQRLRDLLSRATGIDMTYYDGAIINLYDDFSFISAHKDVDESASAIKYPVIGINLGGPGNFSVEDGKTPLLELQAGSAYIFGVEGVNRDVNHRTFPSPQKSFLPELTTKIDGKTYPAGSYRVTITMRRVMPLTEGMPTAPSVVSEPPFSVKPVVKDLKRWSELSNATQPYTDKGIVVTRISNTQEHFGNPFIGSKRRDKQGNLIEAQVNNITVFNTIEEADQAYREWLMGTAHQNIQPARREWILKQINEGKLDGKTLLYYKPDGVINNDGTIVKGEYHSHADTLAEIVEELRGAQPTSKSSEKVNPLVAAGIKPIDMYGNAAKDIQMAQEAIDSADGQFIGFGTILNPNATSSTNKYAAAWGSKANTGNYSSNSVIMVSSSGTFGRKGTPLDEEATAIKTTASNQYKPLLETAIKAGASFRVGNNYEKGVDKDVSLEKIKQGKYFKGNYGDALIAEYLKARGYIEERLDGYSRWTPSQPTSVTTISPVTNRKIISDEDINSYNSLVAKFKNWKPKRFFTSNTKFSAFYNNDLGVQQPMPQDHTWILNEDGNYDMINISSIADLFTEDKKDKSGKVVSKELPPNVVWQKDNLGVYTFFDKQTGDVFSENIKIAVENVDLSTGIQYPVKRNLPPTQPPSIPDEYKYAYEIERSRAVFNLSKLKSEVSGTKAKTFDKKIDVIKGYLTYDNNLHTVLYEDSKTEFNEMEAFLKNSGYSADSYLEYAEKLLLDDSQKPGLIANAYTGLKESKQDFPIDETYLEGTNDVIARFFKEGGKLSKEEISRIVGTNRIADFPGVRFYQAAENKKGTDLELAAQEIFDQYKTSVTAEQIEEFINSYPNGPTSYLSSVPTQETVENTLRELQKQFAVSVGFAGIPSDEKNLVTLETIIEQVSNFVNPKIQPPTQYDVDNLTDINPDCQG